MMEVFATIGHSNRGLGEFVKMLREAYVNLLIDVRSFPMSRTNPAFNADRLPKDLAQEQIGYRHCVALGGRRPKQAGVDQSLNARWKMPSFHNYADYALSDEFTAAFDELVDLGRKNRVAVMCAEAVWWRCHRRIITDYLLLNGHEVVHLMAPGRTTVATPTPGAQRRADGKVIYPMIPALE